MILRQVETAELPKLTECFAEFCRATRFVRGFDMGRFAALWSGLLESKAGVVFGLFDEAGEIQGMLGGLAYPEPYSAELLATEMFWFVRAEERGGGIRLYRAFEQWAREMGCSQIRMVHLLDSMPERLEKVYRRWGFKAAEVHYVRDL